MEANRNEGPDTAPERVSATKRTLLKAGWTAPVILAVGVPVSGFAANCSSSSVEPEKGRVDLPPQGSKPGGGPREKPTDGF